MLSLSLLGGCVSNEYGDDETTIDPIDVETSSETPSIADKYPGDDEPLELYMLRRRLRDAESAVGVAFIDYSDYSISGEAVLEQLKAGEFFRKYPFLLESELVDCTGELVFALVPTDRDSVIRLYSSYINDDGELETDRDNAIYVGEPGESILLRCNMSDAFSNVLVSVSGESVFEFSPHVSMEDGWTVNLSRGCYDFSIDDIRKYVDEGYEFIRKFFELRILDKELLYLGEIELCGQQMLDFGVGEYDDDGYFEPITRYAVSFDVTFILENREWILCEMGIRDLT